MKLSKIMIAVVLLVALLLSSCGQAVPPAAETLRAEETASVSAGTLQMLSAYREAPVGGSAPQIVAAPAGTAAPTTVKNTMFGAKF